MESQNLETNDHTLVQQEVADFDNSFCEEQPEIQESQDLDLEKNNSLAANTDNPEECVAQENEQNAHPVCSSEGSPRSRSDESGSIQNKSVSDDHAFDAFPGQESNAGKISRPDNAANNIIHDIKRDSQIPIYNASDDQNELQEEDRIDHQH